MNKDRIIISIISSICFYGILDFFYIINFGKFNSYLLFIHEDKSINLLIKCLIFAFILFLISFIKIKKIVKIKIQYVTIIFSISIFFLVELFYSWYIDIQKMSFSSHISLLFCIFFCSYLYFYSIFYLDVVKYKRQY